MMGCYDDCDDVWQWHWLHCYRLRLVIQEQMELKLKIENVGSIIRFSKVGFWECP